MEKPEDQDIAEQESSEIVPALVDPRNRVYTTRELGLRVFASRCSVLFDSYLGLLNTFDQQKIAQAVFGMEGTYEGIVAHEKYLIEQHLRRPIREMDSIGPFYASESLPGFEVWKCNGHVIYLPRGYKIVKDGEETDDTDTGPITKQPVGENLSGASTPFLSTPGTLPACPRTSKLITSSRNIHDASKMVIEKLEKMFNNKDERSCSNGRGKMRAKCDSMTDYKTQEVLDSVQDSMMTLLQKLEVIDFYLEGGDIETKAGSWLPHTVAQALGQYLQNFQNMHVEPPTPEVRQRMIVYNEIVAPTYPPNPVATQDSSYGSIPDVSLPFQDYFDINVAWQLQERPVSHFPYVSKSPSESLSGQRESTPFEVHLKTTGEQEKMAKGRDDEKGESDLEEPVVGEQECLVVNQETMKVSNWLQMSEPHIHQPPPAAQSKKSRNSRRKRQAKKKTQQANMSVTNNPQPSSSDPTTSK